MSKKRSNSDNILLPETVVTPHGGYTNFTGEETILPSLEYFKKAEIDKDRINAVSKMLLLNAPIDPHNPSMSYPSKTMGVLGMSDDTRNFIFGNDDKRRTCLYTVSSQYNDTPVASNKAFAKNPEQYGFVEVKAENSKPGDIVQFWDKGVIPHHATMYTDNTPEGLPLISYSNGNTTEYRDWQYSDGNYEVRNGWKKEVHNPRQSMTWGKAQTIFSDNYTGSPYNNLGSFTWSSTPFEKPSINIKSPQIGSYIREGSEQAVYNAAKNADEVKKVQLRRGLSTIDDIRNFHRTSGFMNRNKVPFHERLSISGYLTNPETNSIYPVYSQGKLNPFIEPTTELISQEQLFEWENVIAPEIKEMMRKRGYVGDVNNGFKGPMYVGDIHPRNIGFNKKGQIRIFDLSIE